MTSLLVSRPQSESQQGRPENSINGSDAESFALARVLLACRGEGQWGSREEDSSKIDLIFSTKHPWYSRDRMLVIGQVKSGGSYGAASKSGFTLKSSAKKSAKKTSQGICVVWVDRDLNQIFWAYVHPNSNSGSQEYGEHHRVTPAMVFDLARCSANSGLGPAHGRGIIVSPSQKPLAERRKNSLKAYRTAGQVLSPNLGTIEFTRLGWRHMFRRSRSAKNKSSSIDLVPYLPNLLGHHPWASSVTSVNYEVRNGYEYRTCEHLMKFNGVQIYDSKLAHTKHVMAYVRVIEDVRYPCNWAERAMLSQLIDRRVVLKSAYYKHNQDG